MLGTVPGAGVREGDKVCVLTELTFECEETGTK